ANALSGSILKAPQRLERVAPAPMRKDVRVLVAEDNPVNQKVALRQLEKLGYPADAVANGVEAVEAVSRGGYAAVLMDVQMPEMDGFAAAAEIRRREGGDARVPIIALTANALAGDRERCIEAGMDDYLSKPIAEAELARVLQRYVGSAPPPPALDANVIAGLRDLAGGSDDFLKDIAQIYLEDAPQRIAAIRNAFATGDAAGVAEAAHALKSSSGNVGAEGVRKVCAELEEAGRAGKLDEAKIRQLEVEYARAESELREL
ncbi:MAG: response regulator, partial [Thermoanaerobaculia bacterium]